MFGSIACLGRHTITGIICAQAGQYADWSSVYRLFGRFDQERIFAPVREAVCRHMPAQMPVIAALDDTVVPKRGKKVAGASWRRDPTGPAFRPNFVWAQRFVQMSLVAPSRGFAGAARGIPVDIVHAPTPQKPRKRANLGEEASQEDKEAAQKEWAKYRQDQRAMRVSKVGAERIAHLRSQLNDDPISQGRELIVAVDGGYTNRTVFQEIPKATTLIGRLRKDARLFERPAQPAKRTGLFERPAQPAKRTGRKRLYGDALPTPEQFRQDENIPWTQVKAHAAGKVWDFDVKVIHPVRWKAAGGRNLQLVIIAPIAYRPTKASRMKYRDPAYLLCTDPDLPIEQLLQAYLWRWEIEVNFREEKTIMGTGQAQVRTQTAVETTTAFAVASYAMLQVAALQTGLRDSGLPPPKWRKKETPRRPSTTQLVNRVRAELWGNALGVSFSDFDKSDDIQRSLQNQRCSLGSAVLYATG